MIQIGICEQVSTGKTTCINSILCSYLGETSLKRTTMQIYKFIHTNKRSDQINTIINCIKNFNNNEIQNDIKKVIKFKYNIPIFRKSDLDISLLDFPGFNDGLEEKNNMENLFYEHINFLDHIIFICDSKSALIHKTEKEIISNIIIKLYENYNNDFKYTTLIVVFNKYEEEDEDIIDIVTDAIQFIDKLITETFINIKLQIKYFRVCFQKIMIKNIFLKENLKKNNKILKEIPKNILKNVFSEFYGKKNAAYIINNLYISEKDLNEITLTKDEINFYTFLQNCANKKNNFKRLYNIIDNKLLNIKEYGFLNINYQYNNYEQDQKLIQKKYIIPIHKIKYLMHIINYKAIYSNKDYNLIEKYIIKELLDIIKKHICIIYYYKNNRSERSEDLCYIKLIELLKYINNVFKLYNWNYIIENIIDTARSAFIKMIYDYNNINEPSLLLYYIIDNAISINYDLNKFSYLYVGLLLPITNTYKGNIFNLNIPYIDINNNLENSIKFETKQIKLDILFNLQNCKLNKHFIKIIDTTIINSLTCTKQFDYNYLNKEKRRIIYNFYKMIYTYDKMDSFNKNICYNFNSLNDIKYFNNYIEITKKYTIETYLNEPIYDTELYQFIPLCVYKDIINYYILNNKNNLNIKKNPDNIFETISKCFSNDNEQQNEGEMHTKE